MLISGFIGQSLCTTKTEKFITVNVTDATQLKSKVKSSSSVGCGSWCMNTENCLGFKLDGKNCILYSDYNSHLVGKDPSSFVKIMVPYKHPKITWMKYTKLESSKFQRDFSIFTQLTSTYDFPFR